jgi:hypothetical protein
MDLLKWLRSQWDRTAAVLLVLLGLLALILGYEGVSSTEFVAAQIPYLVSGGLVGLFCLGLGGVLWLSADLRDEWCQLEDAELRLERIERRLEVELASADGSPPSTNGTEHSRRVSRRATTGRDQ